MEQSEKGIQTKLIFFSLVGALVLGVAVSAVALHNSRTSLIRTRMEQLTSIREGAREHIQNYMDLTGQLLVSLAADNMIQNALGEFRESFYTIAEEVEIDPWRIEGELTKFYERNYLDEVNYGVPGGAKPRPAEAYLPGTPHGRIAQYLYIAANPHPAGKRDELKRPEGYRFAYADVHARYHGALNAFLHNFELYDVFLVDLRGTVLYTDFKEQDYVTNLITGPYKDTGLARAFTGALRLSEGEIAFDDFAPYEPSYNLPAAFIGTPVFSDGRREGVFIIQIPIDRINRIMTFNGNYQSAGLGNSGESYLVGPDRRMRNDSRFIEELTDPLVRQLGTTIGVLAVDTEATRAALAGDSGTGVIDDYRGIPVLSSYAPARIFDRQWAVIAEIDKEEALAETAALTWKIVPMSVGLILLAILLSVLSIRRILARPLADITGKVKNLSESGADLTQKIPVASRDEMGLLAGYFNAFIEVLKAQMVKIKRASGVLNDAVQDLSVSSREIETTANNQAAAVKEVVSTMEDSDQLSKSIASRIHDVARVANQTREHVERGFSMTRENKEKMDEIRKTNGEVIDGIKSLGDHIKNIWEIVGIINAVADQTKIIAFNAELEASAAGEAGKNFEIVASEIRRLANNTMTSTREIKSKIIEIQKASDNVILTSEDGTERINQGWQLSHDLEEVFREILDSSESSAESARNITESINQQVQAFEQILLTLKQISESIDNFVVSTRSTTGASETLQGMARDLDAIVGEYRV